MNAGKVFIDIWPEYEDIHVWPEYKKYSGSCLIDMDFKFKYPHTECFPSKWAVNSKKIVELMKEQISNKTFIGKELLSLIPVLVKIQHLITLWCLHSLLVLNKVARKYEKGSSDPHRYLMVFDFQWLTHKEPQTYVLRFFYF